MKKVAFMFVLFFVMTTSIKASCDDEEVVRLSKIANNVTTSYRYNEETKTFELTFTNLTKELVITNLSNNQIYNEDVEFTIKNLKSGSYKFNITSSDTSCTGETMVTKFISLPYYNEYHDSVYCKGIENYSYCIKWVQEKISEDDLKKKTTEYRESLNKKVKTEVIEETTLDKVIKTIQKIYVKYYYIILPLIITGLCVAIYFKDKSDDIL